MRVLGIDPGLSRCGVGLVTGTQRRPVAEHAGVVCTPAAEPVGQRLARLHAELSALFPRFQPEVVAVERVLFNNNARTAMGVGQAAGIVLLCAAQAGVAAVQYTPTQVKATITGSGSADKDQVAYMVRSHLRLAQAPSPADAADALALALCHLQRVGMGPAGGEMSPRLAAALAAAGPGAQIVASAGEGGAAGAAGGWGAAGEGGAAGAAGGWGAAGEGGAAGAAGGWGAAGEGGAAGAAGGWGEG